jgi:hypothetical protein
LRRRVRQLFNAVEAKVEVEVFDEAVAEVHARNVGYGLLDDLQIVDGFSRFRRTQTLKSKCISILIYTNIKVLLYSY